MDPRFFMPSTRPTQPNRSVLIVAFRDESLRSSEEEPGDQKCGKNDGRTAGSRLGSEQQHEELRKIQ